MGWAQQGRAFDGGRLTAVGEKHRIDFLAVRLGDATASGVAANAYLAGGYATFSSTQGTKLDVYALYNRVSGGTDTGQITGGVRAVGKQSRISYRAEVAYQGGTRAGQDVSAYMVGLRCGASVAEGKGKLTLWYDRLSGDDDATDGRTKVFDTLFATNHKYYGFADLFLNIPVHTGGLGLQDVAIKGKWAVGERTSVGVDVHAFLLSKKGTGTTNRLGEEIDLTVAYRYSKEVRIVVGGSYVKAGTALGEIGRLSKDLKFGYTMLDVSF